MRLIKNVGSSYLYKTGVTTYEIHSNDDIINAISLIGINLKQPRKHYKKSKNKKYKGGNITSEYHSTSDDTHDSDSNDIHELEDNAVEDNYEIIQGGNNNIDKNIIKKSFTANSVTTFKHFISTKEIKKGADYNTTLLFLENIGIQLLYFIHNNKSIPFFSLEDIAVVDEKYFLFLNNDKLFQIDDQNKLITIDSVIEYNITSSFIPPELKDMSVIPFKIYYTSAYCSLAMLSIFLFLAIDIDGTEEQFENISYPFIYTQLYFCLKRCIQNIPQNRSLIYV